MTATKKQYKGKANLEIDKVFSELIKRDPEDDRISLLRSVLSDEKFDFETLEKLATTGHSSTDLNSLIITQLLNILRDKYSSKLTDFVKGQDARRSSSQNIKVVNDFWRTYYRYVLDTLKTSKTNLKKVTFISIGCGSGLKETALDKIIRTKFPKIDVKWIGVDKAKYISSESVFSNSGSFVQAPYDQYNNYVKQLVGDTETPIWVLANFAVHHMIINPAEFVKRCSGAERIILLELLVHQNDYDDILYRIVNVGYDLVSNIMINEGWANEFLSGKSSFDVDYWTHEEAGKIFDIWNYPNPHTQRQILHKLV